MMKIFDFQVNNSIHFKRLEIVEVDALYQPVD